MTTLEGRRKLRQWRINLGLSIWQAAKVLDVPQVSLGKWERGERNIPWELVEEIEEATGIPRWELRPDIYCEPMRRAAPNAKSWPEIYFERRVSSEHGFDMLLWSPTHPTFVVGLQVKCRRPGAPRLMIGRSGAPILGC